MLSIESLVVLWFFSTVSCLSVVAPHPPMSNKVSKRDNCYDEMNDISSNVAMKAAEEAKAAQNAQIPAAWQAAYQVKEQLAEKAAEAAEAAQAALASKVALMNELTREKEAVRIVLQEEADSKRQLEQAIREGTNALSGVESFFNTLSSSLKLAETTAQNADAVLEGIEKDLRKKYILLQQAIHAVDLLTREEGMARNDLERTKYATRNAERAAVAAKSNAMSNEHEPDGGIF